MPRTIRQSVTIHASPGEVYVALMDSRKHSKFTGSKATIGQKVGETYRAYDGYITGTNLLLQPGRKIIQTWHASDWPDGLDSRVTFTLKKVKHGTNLMFAHTGVPDDQYESIKKGWITYYWTPMKEMFLPRKKK